MSDLLRIKVTGRPSVTQKKIFCLASLLHVLFASSFNSDIVAVRIWTCRESNIWIEDCLNLSKYIYIHIYIYIYIYMHTMHWTLYY